MAKREIRQVKQNENKPGLFESVMDEYPGFVQFPYPLMREQFHEWWMLAVEGIKNMNVLDYAYHDNEWKAYSQLLLNHGDWRIDGISVSDVKSGNVPQVVANFVMEAGDIYVRDFLPRKAQRLLQGII